MRVTPPLLRYAYMRSLPLLPHAATVATMIMRHYAMRHISHIAFHCHAADAATLERDIFSCRRYAIVIDAATLRHSQLRDIRHKIYAMIY